MSVDEQYIQHCLSLAIKGLGNVAPNPMVGCVIVHNNIIIGEGYHQKYGEAHAEVNAVNSVPKHMLLLIPESTLYVNLEPCSHYGKTPPCADMIIRHKFKRVVIGSFDPNPLVSGNGIKKLQAAGIDVTTGILKTECDFLNRRFLIFHTQKRPYIILKFAQTADGFIAPSEPKQFWITNELSRKLVHLWRSQEPAILVGKRTIEIDNPELTVRLTPGKNPVRITIDKDLKLGDNYKFFNAGTTNYIFNAIKDEVQGDNNWVKIDFTKPALPPILHFLYQMNIQSIIVEGGAFTLNQFIDAGLWDEARIFTGGTLLKNGIKAPTLSGVSMETEQIDTDKLTILYNPNLPFRKL